MTRTLRACFAARLRLLLPNRHKVGGTGQAPNGQELGGTGPVPNRQKNLWYRACRESS
ncbi:MAG: hypothetical protein RBU37_19125 [Myxococcota bacterium]|nr:hypothetical protein [Myxococcota bacterium]